jgi:hypothetical protein
MRFLVAPLYCIALASPLSAQNAQVTGRISDPTGAVIAAAEIRLANIATGDKRTTTSNEQGYYTVLFLDPGSYRVEVQARGFKPVAQTIRLEVEQVARLDFRLEIGALTETVEVSAEAPLVESETGAVGQVVNNKSIVEMPLNGRNAWHLVQMAAATVFVGGIGDAAEIPVASMAGGRSFSQGLWVDGGSVQKSGMARAMAELGPMVDSVQEFKVITNNYAAEYGRSAGGVFTAVTKSGTNELHGNAFEFLRNDAFDARNFFALDKAPLRYNQFGGTLGGPIRHDKTHFFVGFEETKDSRGQTVILTVPTADKKRGIFTGLTDNTGTALPIYNPFTTRPSPTNATVRIRDPFPNNVIPVSLFDPVALKAISFYPEPNVAGNRAGANNFNVNATPQRTQHHGTARVDHAFTERDRVFVRYIVQRNFTPQVSVFPEAAASGSGPQTRTIRNLAHTVMGNYIRTLSPRLVSETKVSWLKQSRSVLHSSVDADWPAKLGFHGVSPRAFPVLRPQGYTLLGGPNAFREQRGPTYQLIEVLTYSRGTHNYKAGFEYRWNGQQDEFDTIPSGDMTFAAQGTGLQGNARTGDGLAALLLGFATSASLRDQIPLRTRGFYLGGFAQDDWKATPRLTLNLGIRYDIEPPPLSPDDTFNGFDWSRTHPVARVPGVVTFAGVDGFPRRIAETDFNNVSPRFGFAWRMFGSDRTVLRGGYGVFFGNTNDIGYGTGTNLGFATEASFVSPDQNQTPAFLLKDGMPAFDQPGPQTRTPAFGLNNAVSFYQRQRATPYSQQFNLGLQQEIRGLLLEAQYIGNLGRKLTAADASINQVRPELVGGAGAIQSRRPFPQFSDVVMVAPNWGASSYHGLVLHAEKRYHSGLQLRVIHTFSKFIDNVDAIANGDLGGTPGAGYQDYYNRRLDKALSPNDVTHNTRFSVIWDLPAGVGRRWLKSGVAAQILGGWQISALGTHLTGGPYGVVTQSNTCECSSTGPQRADLLRTPDLPADERSVARWFDTTAFAQPARFKFGAAARSVGRAPGTSNFDIGLMKNFPVRDRYRIQFRGEFFNTVNHANLGNPGTNLGSPNFGTITTAADGRIIQLGLKIYF